MTHFQIELFLYMVGQLCTRTSGQLVVRAWYVAEQFYQYHGELFNLSIKPHASLAMFMLKAWKKREEVLRASTGSPPETPLYIARLRDLLGSDVDSKDGTSVDGNLPDALTKTDGLVNSVDMPWDQMIGFMDAGSVNWDMFGSNTQSTAHYTNYEQGMGNHQNNTGWM